MTEYMTKADLRRLQMVQLDIMEEFDRICRKHNLVYQLYSGTLLGAVRHKGFIPWDDDLDVCMIRDDYNRFLDIVEKELGASYFMQTTHTDPDYVHAFGRLQRRNTVLVQDSWEHTKMSQMIFIDIFPLDDMNPDTFKGKVHYHLTYQFKRLKRMKRLNFKTLGNSLRTRFKGAIQYPFQIPSMKWYYDTETKIYMMLNGKESVVTQLVDGNEKRYLPYRMNKKEFYNVKEYEYEGKTFLGPVDYDTPLTSIFGDYMSLPKEEDRVPHHGIIELKFDNN